MNGSILEALQEVLIRPMARSVSLTIRRAKNQPAQVTMSKHSSFCVVGCQPFFSARKFGRYAKSESGKGAVPRTMRIVRICGIVSASAANRSRSKGFHPNENSMLLCPAQTQTSPTRMSFKTKVSPSATMVRSRPSFVGASG